jgi:very-short-patch-repair endonuclease
MLNGIFPYNPKLKALAKKLRKESTLSEVLLWERLKKKQIKGYDFHRQKPIDNYIVDFYCSELFLSIEIDGISHAEKEKYDEKRLNKLKSLGIEVLVFSDLCVKQNINGVLLEISNWIQKRKK